MSIITIKDAANADKDINVKLRGTTYTQVMEQEPVTSYVNLDLDENGVSVIGSARLVHNWEIFNRDVQTLFVKLYDKATAPNSGDTPIRVWEIAPGQAFPFQGEVAYGILCSLGVGLRCTTGIAHADTGAPATNGCLINLGHRSAGT